MNKKIMLKGVLIATAIYCIADFLTILLFFQSPTYNGLGTVISILQFLQIIASFAMIKAMFAKIREKKQRRYYIPLFCYFMYMIYYVFNIFDACGMIYSINGYDAYIYYRSYLRLAEMFLAIIVLLEGNKKAISAIVIALNAVLLLYNGSMQQLTAVKSGTGILVIMLFAGAAFSHIYTAIFNCRTEKKGNLKGTMIFVGVAGVFFVATIGEFFLYKRNSVSTYSYSEAVEQTASEDKIDSYFNHQDHTDVSDLSDRINQYLDANKDKFSGSVSVMVGNQMIVEKAYGYADQKNKREYTTDEVFPIISSTGQFVSAAIYQLQEQGKLHVDDTIDHYYPEYDKGSKITIANLLNHTSGIESYDKIFQSNIKAIAEIYGQDDVNVYNTIPLNNEFARLISNCPLQYEPGTKYEISKSDNYLLGLIVERVSGQSYQDYITDHILKPLGLEHTYFTGKKITTFGYYKGKKCDRASNETLNYCSIGMCSTLKDMFTWQNALMSGKVISQNSLNQLLKVNPVTENAQGWEVLDYGYRAYTGDPGNVLMQYVNPQYNISIIAVQNSNAAEAVNCIYDLEKAVSDYYEQGEN